MMDIAMPSLLALFFAPIAIFALQNQPKLQSITATFNNETNELFGNGLKFGHPLMPPPILGLVELYKASTPPVDGHHSHLVEYKGENGVRLHYKYDAQLAEDTSVFCLDHLSGIEDGTSVRSLPGTETVEVHLKSIEQAQDLFQELDGRVTTKTFVTGGTHWNSRHHATKTARPLLLSVGSVSIENTRVTVTGAPVQYSDIFQNLDMSFSTNIFSHSANAHHQETDDVKRKTNYGNAAKGLTLASADDTGKLSYCKDLDGTWKDANGFKCTAWQPECDGSGYWYSYDHAQLEDVWEHCHECGKCRQKKEKNPSCQDNARYRFYDYFDGEESCSSWKGYSCDPYSYTNRIRYGLKEMIEITRNCKRSCNTCEGDSFKPSWLDSVINRVADWGVELYEKTMGSSILSAMKSVGKFTWDVVDGIAHGGSVDVNKQLWKDCWGWNYDCTYKVTESKVFQLGNEPVQCENCYVKAGIDLNFNISIKSFSLDLLVLESVGDLEMHLKLKGDFIDSYNSKKNQQISKSIIGDQSHHLMVFGVPVYFQMKIPLNIGFSAQVDSKISIDASASASAKVHSGFHYNKADGLHTYNPMPKIHPNGKINIDHKTNIAAELHLLPVMMIKIYKFAELNIGIQPGLMLSGESGDKGEQCGLQSHINFEMAMSVSGGVDVDWGSLKIKRVTEPQPIFHQKYPIESPFYTFSCPNSLISADGDEVVVTGSQNPVKTSSPSGIVAGKLYQGSFHRLDSCEEDFMPGGEISLHVLEVRQNYTNTASKCPTGLEVLVTVSDGTEAHEHLPHACLSSRLIQVDVKPMEQDPDRCMLHFSDYKELSKQCTTEDEENASCNIFPELEGSADANFQIIRLHDEHWHGEEACIRGYLKAGLDDRCKDNFDRLSVLTKNMDDVRTCADAEEQGHCADASIADACCESCEGNDSW